MVQDLYVQHKLNIRYDLIVYHRQKIILYNGILGTINTNRIFCL
jgi:hypothetical protein